MTRTRLVEVSANGLAVLDEDSRILAVNEAGAHMLGLAVDDVLGHSSPFDCGDVAHASQSGRRRGFAAGDPGGGCQLCTAAAVPPRTLSQQPQRWPPWCSCGWCSGPTTWTCSTRPRQCRQLRNQLQGRHLPDPDRAHQQHRQTRAGSRRTARSRCGMPSGRFHLRPAAPDQDQVAVPGRLRPGRRHHQGRRLG